jgi:phosphatidylserine/phosphatidylglycerophosphate/cardiolipin synthase-like enzyme
MIGSHNLDSASWRFNLECDIMVDSTEFAATVHESFERDLRDARPMDLGAWKRRPRWLRLVAWIAALFRRML